MLKFSNISDREINKNMSILKRFLEACCYRINDDRIIIYINKLKEQFEPETVRKHIITIKRFLRFINYPLAELIKSPKVPKKRKLVLKPIHIRNLIREVDSKVKYEPLRLRTRVAILLAATSGLRRQGDVQNEREI